MTSETWERHTVVHNMLCTSAVLHDRVNSEFYHSLKPKAVSQSNGVF